MPILLTAVHNRIQSFQENGSLSNRIVTAVVTAADSRYYAIPLKKESQKEKCYHYEEEVEKRTSGSLSADQNISCICELLLEGHLLFVHHHLAKHGGLPSALTLRMRPGEAV